MKRLAGLIAVVAVAVVGAAFIITACNNDPGTSAVFAIPEVGERLIHLQATEVDAHRAADRFPDGFPHSTRADFPEYFGDPGDHTDRGGHPGYYLFLSDEDTYRIGSYMWLPQQDFIVYQGEKITLEILGVRGTSHQSVLVDPDGETVAEFNAYRGSLEIIAFVPEKAGVYQLICLEHQPTMTAYIHALPTQ